VLRRLGPTWTTGFQIGQVHRIDLRRNAARRGIFERAAADDTPEKPGENSRRLWHGVCSLFFSWSRREP
jgi:hypothetical protein